MRIGKILSWVIALFISAFVITPVEAAGEFTADYDVQYSVAPGGVTIVTQNVTLTNQQTNLYPQKYSIVIDSTKISNVIAYDNSGVIRPEVTMRDGKTDIGLTFNEKVVGQGRQLKFSLRYESRDIATKNGTIWEVNIPGVQSDPDLASYSVALQVPPSFGQNAYMSPLPASGGRWTREQMTRGGISAAYGASQTFNVELRYFLENPTVGTKLTELALPPDSAYQKVFVRSLTPEPETVLVDADGNWLAQYELLPAQKIEVKAQLAVGITLHPRADFRQKPIDPSVYLTPTKYWESNNERIAEIAKKYTTPRAIYTYVVDTLSYDYNRVREVPLRKGAASALTTPANSICMEFTDLFIAIARAAGIPAREAVGFAYTTNARLRPLSFVSDVLHAWPEYYDEGKQVWIPVDPTWADTTGGVNYFDKLDFNHIVFAFHGKSSEYPYPAGFYKQSGNNSKDVSVTFAEASVKNDETPPEIVYGMPQKVTAGVAVNGYVYVVNSGKSALSDIPVSVQSSPGDISYAETIGMLPPYAKKAIAISFRVPNVLYRGGGFIATTVGPQEKRFHFEIMPFGYQFLLPASIALGVCVMLLVWYMTSKLWKRRK